MKTKIRKTFLLLAVSLPMFLLTSCGDSETYYFTWDNFTIKNVELYSTNNSENVRVTDTLVFSPLTYGVYLYFEPRVLASSFDYHFKFVQEAQAFTKPIDYYYPSEKIVSIKVRSLNDFDSLHLANSDITECFQARTSAGYLPLDSSYLSTCELNQAKHDTREINQIFSLFLRANPDNENNQQFEFSIKYESGKTLTNISTGIVIKP